MSDTLLPTTIEIVLFAAAALLLLPLVFVGRIDLRRWYEKERLHEREPDQP